MKTFAVKQTQSGKRLSTFVYGSLVVLLLCLLTTAFILSTNYLKKEKQRAAIARDQIFHFFEFQYRALSEEMWTQNYEAIYFQVGSIARELGHADYSVILANADGKCVYSSETKTKCEAPARLAQEIPKFHTIPPQPVIEFDQNSGRHIYMAPLYVGAVLKGYLFVTLSDPYEFYRGGSWDLTLKMLIVPIASVVFVWLLWLLVSQRFILRPYLLEMVEMERKQAVTILAAQVAHDIRSPLVVLKSVMNGLRGLEPAQVKLATTAASRIESIANDLISQFAGKSSESHAVCFASSVIDSMIAEKIALLGDKSKIEIRSKISEQLIDRVVPISATDLSRILSNILNNSIEALENSHHGLIQIILSELKNRIVISISDNGVGMTSHILREVRTVGGSFGKSSGTGMGLQHAKALLASIGGGLDIDSTSGSGTKISLELPLAPLPKWLAKSLDLSNAKNIVVLDDDPSVHLLWRERLGSDGASYISDPEQFDISRFPPETTRYIFDYEISGSPVTGLDLITSNNLGSKAILVTSYFNEPSLQHAIEKAGATMLPKFMISSFPIASEKDSENLKDKNRPIDHSDSCDLVLIDDDLMVHDLWHFEGKQKGFAVRAVSSLNLLNTDGLQQDTPIFVDVNLKGASGFDVAADLHRRGFTNISLATAQAVKRNEVPGYIREIRSKDFPDDIVCRG